MKQMRAHKKRLEQPQNGTRLNSKSTHETRRIEPRRSTWKEDTYKKKSICLAWETRLARGKLVNWNSILFHVTTWHFFKVIF